MTESSRQETLVLLHGIWMYPVVMSWLAHQLRQLGYEVLTPGYASVHNTPAQNAKALHAYLQRTVTNERLHIVGHSLGGLVALHLIDQFNDLPPGRLVTLGSPVAGSYIARMVKPWPLLGMAFGNSMEGGLSGQGIPVQCQREWGAICGTLSVGLGSPFLIGQGVHDGAVCLSETEHPAQKARLCLAVTHTTMLFSRTVVERTHHFLQYGRF